MKISLKPQGLTWDLGTKGGLGTPNNRTMVQIDFNGTIARTVALQPPVWELSVPH